MPDERGAAIAAALDHVFAGATGGQRARAGPFELDVVGRDPRLVASLTPAFRQSDDPARPADATICVLEGDGEPLLEALVGDASATRVLADADYFAMWQHQPARCLHVFDHRNRRGFMWAAEPRMPDWARSRPLLPIVHALAAATNWLPVHAGAVGLAGRFILVVGPSRSGKTTAALACARDGWTFAGDDFVMVDTSTGRVEPIYVSARLRSEVVARFEAFASEVLVMQTELLGESREELRLTQSGRVTIGGGGIAAIVFPRRRGARSIVFEPMPPSRAVGAVTGVTITELLGYRDRLVPKLLRTLKSAPLFECDTGDDPAAIPAAFADLLRRVTR